MSDSLKTCFGVLLLLFSWVFEICRSQARIQKLGDQLGSDTTKNGANEEDSINILSDGEPFEGKNRGGFD